MKKRVSKENMDKMLSHVCHVLLTTMCAFQEYESDDEDTHTNIGVYYSFLRPLESYLIEKNFFDSNEYRDIFDKGEMYARTSPLQCSCSICVH